MVVVFFVRKCLNRATLNMELMIRKKVHNFFHSFYAYILSSIFCVPKENLVFTWICRHNHLYTISIHVRINYITKGKLLTISTFGYLNPSSKASGTAVAIPSYICNRSKNVVVRYSLVCLCRLCFWQIDLSIYSRRNILRNLY